MRVAATYGILVLLCIGLHLGLPSSATTAANAVEPEPANGRSIFKHSLIGAWFDSPDDYKHYDVDLLFQDPNIVSEQDIPKWRKFADEVHAQGKLFCPQLHPVTHMREILEYVMNEPGMQATVCVDLDLNPIKIPWFVGHTYKGRWPCFYCSNHPRYREYIRQQVYMFCEAGADAIAVDDAGGTFFAIGHGGCFCKYCMAGFREYLRAKYAKEDLKRLGVDDADTFDYRQLVLKHAKDNASYLKTRRSAAIPFNGDFSDFLIRSDAELFLSLQRMASKLRGRHVPMGWDNVDLGGSRAPYYPCLDFFFAEINHDKFTIDGKGPVDRLSPAIVMLNKASDALGMWYTPTPAPRSWGAIRDKNLTGLLRQWIAFTYANGGAMRYPRKGWVFSETDPWYYPPKEEFEPVYDFVRKHRELLDGQEAVEQVGVLYTQNAGGGGVPYYTPLKYVCASLVDHNVPFGMAVAGDEMLANRLKGDEADRFELMLIPEPIRLIDGQDKIVTRWKREGKAVAIKQGDDVMAKLADRVKPLAALETQSDVWLFPRTTPGAAGAPLMCHLVASKYDVKSNRTVSQTNVAVRFSTDLWGKSPAKRVTYYTIGETPREIGFEPSDGSIRVTVPEVKLWGILKVEP